MKTGRLRLSASVSIWWRSTSSDCLHVVNVHIAPGTRHGQGSTWISRSKTRRMSPKPRRNKTGRENSIRRVWSVLDRSSASHDLENAMTSREITVDTLAKVHPQR